MAQWQLSCPSSLSPIKPRTHALPSITPKNVSHYHRSPQKLKSHHQHSHPLSPITPNTRVISQPRSHSLTNINNEGGEETIVQGGEMEIATGGGGGITAAPFVLKTYWMVNDPATDAVIRWGRENNSFVVVDHFNFSQTLLPAYFKHNNFSSFVRQLNTYGFKKVDPDRWEFAHLSFLRGQTQLLCQIVRRNNGGRRREGGEEEEDEVVAGEVVKLMREQRVIDERLGRMFRRMQEMERRPWQIHAFLLSLVGDPLLLRRLMARGWAKEKRARLCLEGKGLESNDDPVAGFFVEEGFRQVIDAAAAAAAAAASAAGDWGIDLGVGERGVEGAGPPFSYLYHVNNGI